ncbi:MAG: hypothetical protein RLZZ67_587 [Candidatus Parcubacteria bacterium]|jgi:hypothetical protein
MNLRLRLLTVDNSSVAIGDIFTNKKSIANGGGVKHSNPKLGDTGWKFQGSNAAGEAIFEELVFDKGGNARKHHSDGGAIFSELPAWVTLTEHRLRKEARSRYWQKAYGPADYVIRHRRLRGLEWRGIGMYGSDDGIPLHPHAHA